MLLAKGSYDPIEAIHSYILRYRVVLTRLTDKYAWV